MKRTKIRKKGKSEISQCKTRIQALLRDLAIIRDGGCVMKHYQETGKCGGRKKNGELILQFDHLHSRTNSTAWNLDLGICVCLRHHFYYKRQYPFEYERYAIDNIGKKREELLYRTRADNKPYSMKLHNWLFIEMGLTQDIKRLTQKT